MYLLKSFVTFNLLLCQRLNVFSEASESNLACSKYPYEEQLLGKMTRVQIQMEQWDSELKKFEETVLAVLEHRREEMSKLIENINSKMENIEQKNKTQKDDMNIELDKISKELTTLQDELANLTKGRIEAPTVAFNAYLTTSGSYTENQIIKFPHILLNEGNGYNETSGYFTATVSGLYQFFAHVCNQPSQYMTFSIVHGETEVGRSAAYEDSRF